jgi:IS4 transposase
VADKACCVGKADLTYGNQPDNKQMDDLILFEPGALYVFDRGYLDHKKFDTYCENNIRFVTRLKKNIAVRVIEEVTRPKQEGDPIIREAIVVLGSQKKKMKNPLRLIELKDTKGNPITVITNDFEVTPEEIGTIYRNRWVIETFFRWIKQNLAITKLYGTTQNAVYNQIMISLILFNLLVLLHPKVDLAHTLGILLKKIRLFWDQSFNSLKEAYNKETRKRLKSNEQEFVFN